MSKAFICLLPWFITNAYSSVTIRETGKQTSKLAEKQQEGFASRERETLRRARFTGIAAGLRWSRVFPWISTVRARGLEAFLLVKQGHQVMGLLLEG